jgi:hypothetical protein
LNQRVNAKGESMRFGNRAGLPVVAVVISLLWADHPGFALPPIQFAGSRPAKITEEPMIPLDHRGDLGRGEVPRDAL